MAADFFLQLEDFSPAQVFENKLEAALSGAPLEAGKGGKLAGLARPFLEAWRLRQQRREEERLGVCRSAGCGLGQMVAGFHGKRNRKRICRFSFCSAGRDAQNCGGTFRGD